MTTLDSVTPVSATAAERPVRIVDSDVHPIPRPGAVAAFLSATDREELAPRGRAVPEMPNYYDVPDFGKTSAMRADAFPPGGGFPGSDPEFAAQQLLSRAGVDIGVLEPLGNTVKLPEHEHALRSATNDWLAAEWLSAPHRRWRGSISISSRTPELAAAEIRRWQDHPMMVQVLMSPQTDTGFGDPAFDPIYRAACEAGRPVCTHLMGLGPFERTPYMPVGNQAHWADFMASWPLLFAHHVMSLVFDGTFDRFPDLRVVFVEGAFTWVLPVLWRMDRTWEQRRGDVGLPKRRPSEYVREHVRFTTQPLEEPENAEEFRRYLEWFGAGEMLLFSTDYPHWSYDEPAWVSGVLPAAMRESVMWRNASELFGLPRTVPALGA